MQPSSIHTFDPLKDLRWPEFVYRHPNASVFHSRGWLSALQRTYRYEPIAFTTSTPTEELRSVVVFCAVRSWLAGNRLVSLPFSDHCEPLVQSPEEFNELLLFVQHIREQQRWKYVEMRPANSVLPLKGAFQKGETYYLHRLDLRPSLEVLLHSFHKDSVQRKIRKAEREGVG